MIRKTLIRCYKPKDIYWLLRANITHMPRMRCWEFTFGLFGYGILLQFYYGKDRVFWSGDELDAQIAAAAGKSK